ncbi:MAG TPA: SpoIIE family protein phosphatase [Candidatus Dormibacteraeota bacterium]|nr:SpoIIE family protein phosphatase [Candidatus Dormibacteraeota bacterium]
MATGWRIRVKALWRRSSALDRLAALLVVLSAAFWALLLAGWPLPVEEPPLSTDLLSILFFFSAIVFLMVRGRHWMGNRLLWSVRNRLILAYIFIAVVPIVLLLAMGGILTYMAEVEVAAHLLHEDMNGHLQRMAAVSREALSLARVTAPAGAELESLGSSAPIQVLVQHSQRRLPGLVIDFLPATAATEAATSPNGRAQLVEQNGRLWIEGASIGQLANSRWVEAIARLPVTSQFLDNLAAQLGPITFGRPLSEPALRIPVGATRELLGPKATASITLGNRSLPPARSFLDIRIIGATTFPAVRYAGLGSKPVPSSLVATFTMRASSMGHRIESSLGEFASFYVILLLVVTGLFIVLWLLALIAGMVLTVKITRMMAKLDEATHHVKARDFSHRISIVQRDQLGALAESFNSMTASIEGLLDEQRQRQRLENELAIAREVQSQLFPHALPSVAGLEVGAICQAARIVSGDYYDCMQLDATHVAMLVADISGKGISAALLMANLSAALRSQVLSNSSAEPDTGALAARLNRHLLLNTSDDRYATLFFAVYDAASHVLRYTNAGHLPPFFITDNRVEKLDRGGTVIGLLDHCVYEEASITVKPGSLLVAYSDGMTEPENAQGEEFGSERLIGEILRHRDEPPGKICGELIETVRNWCAPAEPFDDQTVLVARMG